MLLSALLQDIYPLPETADRNIHALFLDSRQIKANSLFVAIKGSQSDGRKFIYDAIEKGATAVLVENTRDANDIILQQNIPLIPIQNLPQLLGKIAGRFYGNPAQQMRMIGVTGTSGKTSCTQFIAQCLEAHQIRCGIIGTIGSGFYGALSEVGLTTPDAITLHATLKGLLSQGAQALAMEVSSHSIDQGRVNGIDFDVGVYTNLSQDHLDYHGDMASYAQVKKRFLAELSTKQLVINADDVYGREWINELRDKKPVIAYSTQAVNAGEDMICAQEIVPTLAGSKARILTPWGEGELNLPLVGSFNLSNSLAVLACLCLYGIPLPESLRLLSRLKTVPGRMQALGGSGQPLVIVDYAHKPDALEKVLQALRAHTEGKLICVFGCGGERDRGKRPIMASIAERWSDQVIVTNDNPRHERPEDIAAEIMGGFAHPERVFVELDRSKAIQNSIQLAAMNDCVLIAGKGAEHYQQFGDEKFPFDDVEQATQVLLKL